MAEYATNMSKLLEEKVINNDSFVKKAPSKKKDLSMLSLEIGRWIN